MAMRIQNNIAALNAQNNLQVSQTGMQKSLERLSSGYRINGAKDDAAGLAISQGFRANIASVKVAQRNITEANALLQVAEGAMNGIGDILTRMKELATQASSANVGSNGDKIKAEYLALYDEIDRIVESTKYAGSNVIDGTFGGGAGGAMATTDLDVIDNVYDVNVTAAVAGAYTITTDAGANTLTITKVVGGDSETESLTADGVDGAQTINFDRLGISFKTTAAADSDDLGTALAALGAGGLVLAPAGGGGTTNFQIGYENDDSSQLGVSISAISASDLGLAVTDFDSATLAFAALLKIDNAVDELSGYRGDVGAYQNRLSYASGNLSVTLENFTAAESAIRDVDMAAEMTTFTKNQILVQAGTAMLAQANMAPQQILSLLKG